MKDVYLVRRMSMSMIKKRMTTDEALRKIHAERSGVSERQENLAAKKVLAGYEPEPFITQLDTIQAASERFTAASKKAVATFNQLRADSNAAVETQINLETVCCDFERLIDACSDVPAPEAATSTDDNDEVEAVAEDGDDDESLQGFEQAADAARGPINSRPFHGQ